MARRADGNYPGTAGFKVFGGFCIGYEGSRDLLVGSNECQFHSWTGTAPRGCNSLESNHSLTDPIVRFVLSASRGCQECPVGVILQTVDAISIRSPIIKLLVGQFATAGEAGLQRRGGGQVAAKMTLEIVLLQGLHAWTRPPALP